MNSLICSHMQEESLGLNMGLYVLFQQDKLMDTDSRTNIDKSSLMNNRESWRERHF